MHTPKKILVMLMKDIYWNLFLNIIHILAIFFLLSSGYKPLSISFLIKPRLFDKVAKKSFFLFFKAYAKIDGQKSFTVKPILMNIVLTDFIFGCDLPTII